MTDFAALTLSIDATQARSAVNELDKLSDAGSRVERDVTKSTSIISGSFDSLKTAALGLASAYGAVSAVKGLTDAAVDIQKFESTFRAATGSISEASKELDFVRKISNDLGLDLRTTAEQYSKLAAAARDTKLEGKDTRDIFVGVSQAAVALGARADETAGALNAIQQIISKNVVSMEELRGQLGERLPGAMRIAQQAVGLTSEEFNKLVSNGNLTADVLLPKMAAQFQKTFGNESQAAAQGLSAQVNRFNNALFELQVAIGRTGIIEFFTNATQSAAGFVAKSADIVKLYSNDIKIAFAALIDVGRGVINTFHAAGLGIAAIVEQVKALLQLDIKKAISINPVDIIKKPFQDSLTKTYDETIKSIANKPIELPEAKVSFQADVKIPSVLPALKQVTSKSKEISESERFIQSLKREAEEANKTEIELLQLRASKLGVSSAAAPLIAIIDANTKAFNAQQDAASKLTADLNDVARVTESVKTAEEKLADETARLNKLLNLPNNAGISLETYNRAIKKANDEFVKLSTQSKKTFDEMSQFAVQAERNIQTAFGDALRQGFEGNLGGMVSSFKSALAQMVAQAISADVLGAIFGRSQGFGQTKALFDSLKSVISGGGSSVGGDSTASLLNGITGLGTTFKDGFSSFGKTLSSGFSGLSRIFTSGNVALGTGVGGLGGAGSALANGVGAGTSAGGFLSGGLGGAVGTLGAGAVGVGIGSMLGGDKKLFGLGSGTTSTIGAALGAFGGPIGAALGGIIGGGLNALFGRGPLKQKETNLIGTATASGFEGITSTKLKAEGGLLVGDKVIRIQADANTGKLLGEFNGKLKDTAQKASEAAKAVGLFVNEGITQISSSIKDAAAVMGIGTDAIKAFSQSINIASEKGKGITEEQLGKVVTEFGDAMAKQLIPNIEEFSKRGESAAGTFLRLSNEFQVLTDVLEVMGQSTQQAAEFLKGVPIAARESFLSVVGGADKLSSQLLTFADNFLTVEERLKPVGELVSKTFKELGISGVTTNKQFADLVKSQDLTTEAGQKMFASLLDIQDEFLAMTKAFGVFGGTVENTTEIIKKATEEQERAASRRVEIARRDKARLAQEEETKKLAEARAKEVDSARLLRAELLRAGDAMALVANEFKAQDIKFNKDADFNAQFADAQAKLSIDLIDAASSAAIEINNVESLLQKLYRNVISTQVVEPIYKGIKESVLSGVEEFGKVLGNVSEKDRRANSSSINSISRAIDGFARVMAQQQASRGADRLGQGIASVLGARRELSRATATESVGGRLQFGTDVIAYAKAIDQLNKEFDSGKISANQHKQAIEGLNKVSSSSARLFNDTAAQMERIRRASLDLGKAGLDGIGFYFNNIAKSVRELDRQAAQLDEPLSKVSQAVGRMKSIAFVFKESAEAVRDGFKDFAPNILRGLEKAGTSLSKADIVGKAAQLASGILNTQSGKEKEQAIKADPLFSGKDARDLSLLIEGVAAFDPESFERSFLRISDALRKNQINEAQFAKLFNIALDSFEGLASGAGRAAGGLSEIGKAAKSAADNIRLDRKLTLLNPQQQLQEAQKQFIDVINRAKGGDKQAAGQLEGAARSLLETGQISLSNQSDLFTFVQAKLREVEGAGTLQSLEVNQNILKQIEAMNKRIDENQKNNTLISAQIAGINMRTADTLDRWEKNGMPPVRT